VRRLVDRLGVLQIVSINVLARIELYTPKHKRTHGYYVLPFLFGDRVVGRVDLKADCGAQTLQVLSAHCESGIAADVFVAALADEIRLMARWLGLCRAWRRAAQVMPQPPCSGYCDGYRRVGSQKRIYWRSVFQYTDHSADLNFG
jgi:uncharacterized protein YcaQ